jgi:hypothetical protein
VVVAVSATKLVAGVLCTAALAGAFVLGQLSGPRRAQAASSRFFVLHVGDRVAIPVIGQRCSVEVEGGFPDLFCQRIRNAHHQVVFFRDEILVYRIGDPDRPPVWRGKP